jgi:hypothetical protein
MIIVVCQLPKKIGALRRREREVLAWDPASRP